MPGRGRIVEALGGRGRAQLAGRPVDAPVDGTAALQIEVTAAEPDRVTGDVGARPRLRVAPPAPISAPRAPFVATVIGVVIVGVLGILLINTKTNENSFRIADLQKQDTALDNQQQDLENQLVAASSIGNLDAAARRLGLVKAENPAPIPAARRQDHRRARAGRRQAVVTAGTPRPRRPPADTGTADGTAANGQPANGTAANGTAANGTGNGAANGTATDGTAGTARPANGTARPERHRHGQNGTARPERHGDRNGADRERRRHGTQGGTAPAGTGQ